MRLLRSTAAAGVADSAALVGAVVRFSCASSVRPSVLSLSVYEHFAKFLGVCFCFSLSFYVLQLLLVLFLCTPLANQILGTEFEV